MMAASPRTESPHSQPRCRHPEVKIEQRKSRQEKSGQGHDQTRAVNQRGLQGTTRQFRSVFGKPVQSELQSRYIRVRMKASAPSSS